MAQEAPGQTLQATALVHEAYLRLVGELKLASSKADLGLLLEVVGSGLEGPAVYSGKVPPCPDTLPEGPCRTSETHGASTAEVLMRRGLVAFCRGDHGRALVDLDLFVILLIQRDGLPNADASRMRQAVQALAAAALKK